MTHIDDETLSAYSDGELPESTSREIEAALATSPELQQRLNRLQNADVAAREWFTQGDNDPLPAGLEQLIRDKPLSETAQVVPLARRVPAPVWGLAASLVLGVALLLQQPPGMADKMVQFADTGRTGEILQGNGWRAEISGSFDVSDNLRCREIIRHTPEQSDTLLACGHPGDWRWEIREGVEGYQTASGPQQQYRQLSDAEERQWLKSAD